MATSGSSSARYLRECPVCLDDMVNKTPKLLDCKHSFCFSCISGLAVAHGNSGLKVPCPKCKHDTVVKSGTLADLPDNFLLNEFKAALDEQNRHSYCFYCRKVDTETKAVSLYTECSRFTCEDCGEKHRKLFPRHGIVRISDKEQRESCHQHNEPAIYVCRICSPLRLLCDVCMMVHGPCHTGENLREYTDAFSEVETKMKTNLDQLNNMDEVFSKWEEKVQSEISAIIDAVKTNVASKVEDYSNLNSMKLAVEAGKEAGTKAQKLLQSENRQLDGFQKAHENIAKALKKFTEEEQRAKVIGSDLQLESKISQLIANFKDGLGHILFVKLRFVTSIPTTHCVSKLRASTDGRVLYVCKGSQAIAEVNSDRETRTFQTNHKTKSYLNRNIAFDMLDNQMLFTCRISQGWNFYRCELYSDYSRSLPSFSDLAPMYNKHCWDLVDLCLTADKIMVIRSVGILRIYSVSSGKVEEHKILYKDDFIHLTNVKCGAQAGCIATYISHNTMLYHDEEGNVLQTLCKDGSPISQPKATTISPTGHILVADAGASKIVELTMKGEFVRDVLTGEDGLRMPVNVVYSDPFLWVADQTRGGESYLKCFAL